MMYGFGDEREVFQETVATLEDAVQDYVAGVVRRSRWILMDSTQSHHSLFPSS